MPTWEQSIMHNLKSSYVQFACPPRLYVFRKYQQIPPENSEFSIPACFGNNSAYLGAGGLCFFKM